MSQTPSQQQRIRRAFHRAAPRYDAHAHQQREVLAALAALAAPYMASPTRVLDIGCGTGALADIIDWPVLGLDAAEAMCRYANAARGITTVAADMHHLPFANASMPAMISSLALQWSADKAQALAEWQRVLTAGGVLAFSVYLDNTLNGLKESFKAIGLPSPLQVFVSHEELLEMIKKAGLQLLSNKCDTLNINHNNLISLIKYLKIIGASTPSSSGGSLRTKQQLARLEAAYLKRCGSVTSHWEVGYYVLQKAP